MNDTIVYDAADQRKIRHIFSDMGLCQCGSDRPFGIVAALLERAETGGSFYEPLGDQWSGEAVEFAAKVMSSPHWGLMKHNGAVGVSWLTPRGKDLLKFFKDFGTDPDQWPMWWCSCDEGERW